MIESAVDLQHVVLRIELALDRVLVESELQFAPRGGPTDGALVPLVLDGVGLELLEVSVDGTALESGAWARDDRTLTVELGSGAAHVVRTLVAVTPGGPADSGLTVRPGLLSSNCEPEGFRRMTWFPDRPDVRATFDVTLVGDPAVFPVMLSNGDLVEDTSLPDGRRAVRFVDPVTKPSYLFSMVAGALSLATSSHVTRTGRTIALQVAAPPEQIGGAGFALDLLDRVMSFDEEHGGIEHDLDTLTLVAIPGYPDATEYHGLMFFESSVLVADQRGVVDDDLLGIIANVAHEYGHHVRGNRVTVRSWGNLALKEGLTVLFQNDVRRALFGAAGRVLDVLDLRRLQFPEEVTIGAPVVRGEVRDPHQLYTRTTYLKGAEVFGMLRTVLGGDLWNAAFDRFQQQYDLGAATVDDFLMVAREVAPGHGDRIDGVARWFSQAGRPQLSVTSSPGPDGSTTVTVERLDSLADDPPLLVPVAVGFHDADGGPLPVTLLHGSSAGEDVTSHLLLLDERSARVEVRRPVGADGGADGGTVVVSALAGYSAPVDLALATSSEHLAALLVGADDAVTRWWASEELMIRVVDHHRAGRTVAVDHDVALLTGALAPVLRTERDPLLLAQLVALPDEFMLGDRDPIIDVDGVHRGLGHLRDALGRALHDDLVDALDRLGDDDPLGTSPGDIARRAMVDPVLDLLLASSTTSSLEVGMSQLASPNPTRALRAFAQLAHLDGVDLDQLAADTAPRWSGAPKLLDRWLRAQSGSRRADTIERVGRLVGSDLYDRGQRSRLMAIWFPFCTRNRSVFHDPSGAGYRTFVDEVPQLLQVNPAVVLRLVGDLLQFQRFDPARRDLMAEQLQRFAAMEGLPPFAVRMLTKLLPA